MMWNELPNDLLYKAAFRIIARKHDMNYSHWISLGRKLSRINQWIISTVIFSVEERMNDANLEKEN